METRGVSFSLKIAKSTDEPLKTVSAAEMKSFREEKDRLVWRGHPVLGDSFTVTAERKVVAEGVEWRIAYEGNETDWFVEEVSFPEWAVPRTDGTKVFVPRICGMVMAPDWKKAPPRQVMAWQGPGFGAPHCIAALGEEGESFYLDQRGEARFHSSRFDIAQGVKPGTCVLKSVCILPITVESRRAYRVPYPSVAAKFRGGWFEAVAIHREWVHGQDWYKKVVQDALPAVFRSVWRSKKGRTAAVLVNWSRKEQAYSLEAPDVASRGTIPARSWIAVESAQRR